MHSLNFLNPLSNVLFSRVQFNKMTTFIQISTMNNVYIIQYFLGLLCVDYYLMYGTCNFIKHQELHGLTSDFQTVKLASTNFQIS